MIQMNESDDQFSLPMPSESLDRTFGQYGQIERLWKGMDHIMKALEDGDQEALTKFPSIVLDRMMALLEDSHIQAQLQQRGISLAFIVSAQETLFQVVTNPDQLFMHGHYPYLPDPLNTPPYIEVAPSPGSAIPPDQVH